MLGKQMQQKISRGRSRLLVDGMIKIDSESNS